MFHLRRPGAFNPALLVIFVGVLILSVILLVNAYRFFVPAAYTIDKSEVVEALEVIQNLTPLRKNGLQLAQAESLKGGGSSRLVITHPAPADGPWLLIRGTVSSSFLASKITLDRMLHLAVNATDIVVTSDGQPVTAVLLLSRIETNPLRADAASPDPEVDVFDMLFKNQTLLPVPAGTVADYKFTSNNGMIVDASAGMGRSGAVSLMDTMELSITLDPESKAWVDMPRTVRVQHTAVGAENLMLGILIPRNAPGAGPFKIMMFGDEVASISRM